MPVSPRAIRAFSAPARVCVTSRSACRVPTSVSSRFCARYSLTPGKACSLARAAWPQVARSAAGTMPATRIAANAADMALDARPACPVARGDPPLGTRPPRTTALRGCGIPRPVALPRLAPVRPFPKTPISASSYAFVGRKRLRVTPNRHPGSNAHKPNENGHLWGVRRRFRRHRSRGGTSAIIPPAARFESSPIHVIESPQSRASPSGKATASQAVIRGFESRCPLQVSCRAPQGARFVKGACSRWRE